MSTLYQLVAAHHDHARHLANKTMRCEPGRYGLNELVKVGRKFTTRVERRLRKMEMASFRGRP